VRLQVGLSEGVKRNNRKFSSKCVLFPPTPNLGSRKRETNIPIPIPLKYKEKRNGVNTKLGRPPCRKPSVMYSGKRTDAVVHSGAFSFPFPVVSLLEVNVSYLSLFVDERTQ
jgi:hypothetical protein